MDLAKQRIDELAETGDVYAIDQIKEIAVRYPDNIPYALNAYGRIGSKNSIIGIEGLTRYSQVSQDFSSTQKAAHYYQALDLLTNVDGNNSVSAVRAIKNLSIEFPDFIPEGFTSLLNIGSSEAYRAMKVVTDQHPETRTDAISLLKEVNNRSAQRIYDTLLRQHMNDQNAPQTARPPQKKKADAQTSSLMSAIDKGRIEKMKRWAKNSKDDHATNKIRTVILSHPRLITPALEVLSDMGTEKSISLIEEIADKFPIYTQPCIDALVYNESDSACASVYDVLLKSPANAKPLYDHGMVSYAIETLMKSQSRNAVITAGEIVKMCPSHLEQAFDHFEEALADENIEPSYYRSVVQTIGEIVDDNPQRAAYRGLSILSPQNNKFAQSVFEKSVAKINMNSRIETYDRLGLSGHFSDAQPAQVPDPEEFKEFLANLLDDLEARGVDMPGDGFSELGQ